MQATASPRREPTMDFVPRRDAATMQITNGDGFA
jgi:hypothetical protein